MRKMKFALLGALLAVWPSFSMAANQQVQFNLSEKDTAKAAAVAGGAALFFMMVWLGMVLVTYIYFAICLMKLAKKTGTENAWMAWVPILDVFLMVKISGKPSWWFLLFFVPLVNIVIAVIIWMAIAKRLGKPDWLGILIIVPVANLIMPGYLAFSSGETTPSFQQPSQPQQPEQPQPPQEPQQPQF